MQNVTTALQSNGPDARLVLVSKRLASRHAAERRFRI
jgi:hypothetical protein